MLLGVLMLLTTGLAWAFTGVLLSHCARNRIRAVTLLGPQMALGLLLAFSILPNHRALAGGLPLSAWLLAAVLIGSGLLNAMGILTMQRAMRAGHHGITWAIGQSAMVLPFLAGTLLFGEPVSSLHLVGVGAIVISLAVLGGTRKDTEVQDRRENPRSWFLLAVATLVLLGLGLVMAALPSHMPRLTDPANLRVPSLCLGNAIIYLTLWGREGGMPDRRTMALAVVGAIVGTASTLTMFCGLDLLSQAQMAAVGFPIAVGTCVVSFGLYSAVVLREPVTRWHLVGLALGLVGVVCVSTSG